MISFENTEVVGFVPALRGMRNPMNSWDNSDTTCFWACGVPYDVKIGEKDLYLADALNKAGPTHSKYRRMINVYVDIIAPLYWWKQMDTYKVGTVADSCSTMHKIAAKEFEPIDFSHEKLTAQNYAVLSTIIAALNAAREEFLNASEPVKNGAWWQMVQLLPSSYNQRRTLMLNYEVLANIHNTRRTHKLTEWHDFCKWIRTLPYSELIVGGQNEQT